jgi:hypothetical protein
MPVMWETPLSNERREEIITAVTREVKKRKLETPAILFLEMHKPIAGLASHAAVAVSPFVMPFLGFKNVDEYSQFIASRENIERLIQSLEQSPEPDSESPKEIAP